MMFEVNQVRMEFKYDNACNQLRLKTYYTQDWVKFSEINDILLDSINATLKGPHSEVPCFRAKILLEALPYIA